MSPLRCKLRLSRVAPVPGARIPFDKNLPQTMQTCSVRTCYRSDCQIALRISVRQEFLRALPRTIGFALAPVQDSAYTRAVDTRAVNVRMTFLSRAGLPRPFVFVCSGAHRITLEDIMKQDRRRQPLGQQKRTVKEMNATWLTHPWRNSKPS